MRETVSVVIPVYNARDYIVEALDSIARQTVLPTEIILADDCSPDDSMALCKQWATQSAIPVRLLHMPENGGGSKARNAAIAAAQSDWILFLDADDRLEPSLLADLLARYTELAHIGQHCILLHAAAYQIDGDSRMCTDAMRTRQHAASEILGALMVRNFIIAPSGALVRKTALDAVGGFSTEKRIIEDWELWLRLAALEKPWGYVDTPLVAVRRHDANNTADAGKVQAAEQAILSRYTATEIRDAIFRRNVPQTQNTSDFAGLMMRLGHWEAATQALDEPAAETSASLWFSRALLAWHQDDTQGAKNCYREVLALQPTHGAALNNLAVSCALTNDTQTAQQYLIQALSLYPEYRDAEANLALIQSGQSLQAPQCHITMRELRPVLPRYNPHPDKLMPV